MSIISLITIREIIKLLFVFYIIKNELSDGIHNEFSVIALSHPLIYIYGLINDVEFEEAMKYRSNGGKIFDLLMEDIPSILFISFIIINSNDYSILGLISLSISMIILLKTSVQIYFELNDESFTPCLLEPKPYAPSPNNPNGV